MTPIKKTKKQIQKILEKRLPKRTSKNLVWAERACPGVIPKWKKEIIKETYGNSPNLKDIRIMMLFGCSLNSYQMVKVALSGQCYQLVD